MRSTPALLCLLLVACADAADPVAPADAVAEVDAAGAPDAETAADTTAPDTQPTPDTLAPDDTADTADAADTADTPPPPAPVITFTVNRIPASMNGAVPWDDLDGGSNPFTLRVNRALTTLDVLADLAAGGPVSWDTLHVACDSGGVALSLGPFTPAADAASASLAIAGDDALPDGALVTCLAEVAGPGGVGLPSGLTFEAAALPAALDPFVDVDPWLVILTRDIFEVATTPNADGTVQVWSTYRPGGDGVPDFLDALYLLGLASPDHPDATEVVRAHLVRAIRARANRIFGLAPDGSPTPEGVPLRLWFEGDPGAPTPADHASGVSLIALGGDGAPSDQAGGTFGRAMIDWNNQGVEDNSVYGLGVFTTAVARAVLGQPIGVILFAELLPSQGGLPIGAYPDDALFIGQDTFDGAVLDGTTLRRAQLYTLVIDLAALALASILTHEIGHSLGLVPYHPPPRGLFAGVAGPAFLASFAPDAHIDTHGLNIMQTGGSVDWVSVLDQEPTFNPLNWAYLRRQLVVGPP